MLKSVVLALAVVVLASCSPKKTSYVAYGQVLGSWDQTLDGKSTHVRLFAVKTPDGTYFEIPFDQANVPVFDPLKYGEIRYHRCTFFGANCFDSFTAKAPVAK